MDIISYVSKGRRSEKKDNDFNSSKKELFKKKRERQMTGEELEEDRDSL